MGSSNGSSCTVRLQDIAALSYSRTPALLPPSSNVTSLKSGRQEMPALAGYASESGRLNNAAVSGVDGVDDLALSEVVIETPHINGTYGFVPGIAPL